MYYKYGRNTNVPQLPIQAKYLGPTISKRIAHHATRRQKDASSERQMRVLTEAPLGGPAIKADSKHLNTTLNFTLRPGGSSSVLGYWTFGSLCLMGARPPTTQPGQGCTIRHYGCRWPVARLGALTRRWLQTGARITSHEPRTVSVLRLPSISNTATIVGAKHYLACPTSTSRCYQYALARALARSSTPRLIPAFTATQQTPRASEALLGESTVRPSFLPANDSCLLPLLTYARTSMHS